MNDDDWPELHAHFLNSLQIRARIFSVLLLGLAACAIGGALLAGEQPALQKDATPPKQSTAAPPVPKKNQKKAPKKLNGAELYALHCNRCHPERYAAERTAEQWKTILLHMRTRANIPAEQARAILEYLQEDSGK